MKKNLVTYFHCAIDKDKFPNTQVEEWAEGELSSAEVLIWSNDYPFTEHELSFFPNLRLFINWGTSDSNIKIKSHLEKLHIKVKYVDYYATEALAEYILGIIILSERNLIDLSKGIRKEGQEIFKKRIGVIGLGKIGFRVAQILFESFECSIRYTATRDKKISHFTYSTLKEILINSDYLLVTVKSKNYTIALKDLEKANRNLIIFNITNEDVISRDTINRALEKNYIRGYVADVKKAQDTSPRHSQAMIIPKAGYLTQQAKTTKLHILQMFLKKYFTAHSPNPKNVYVVRHGGTSWNKKNLYQGTLNSPLTKEGTQHALDIARFLKNKHITKIYTSPLGRALETAEILHHELSVPFEVVHEFREINFGIFQGKDKDTIKKTFPEFFEARAANKLIKLYQRYPGGESYFNVYLRVLNKTLELMATQDNFVIIGHEGVNRIIRAIISEKNPEENVDSKQNNDKIYKYNLNQNNETLFICSDVVVD